MLVTVPRRVGLVRSVTSIVIEWPAPGLNGGNDRVPLAIGPGVTLSARTVLRLIAFRRATKSNMLSTGRAITVEPWILTCRSPTRDPLHTLFDARRDLTCWEVPKVLRLAFESPQPGMSEHPAASAQDVSAIRTRSFLDPMRSARLVGREPGTGWQPRLSRWFRPYLGGGVANRLIDRGRGVNLERLRPWVSVGSHRGRD